MFKSATKYFTELSESAEWSGSKCFAGSILVQESYAVCEIENVYTWIPSDVEQVTVIRMPSHCVQGGESIMVIYEKFFHRMVGEKSPEKEIWYCDCNATLNECLRVIKNNFLL